MNIFLKILSFLAELKKLHSSHSRIFWVVLITIILIYTNINFILFLLYNRNNDIFDNPSNYILLSASQLWLNTGIEVEKGEKYQFRVSGGVNTAAHKTFVNAYSDKKSAAVWTFYPQDQMGMKETDDYDKYSSQTSRLIVDKNSQFGNLLVCVFPNDYNSFSKVNLRNNALDSCKYTLNKTLSWNEYQEFTFNHSGIVYLIVNDWILEKDDFGDYEAYRQKTYADKINIYKILAKLLRNITISDAERADLNSCKYSSTHMANILYSFYGKPPNNIESYKEYEKNKWTSIKNDNYWNLWYEDNIGAYLIEIKKIKEKNPIDRYFYPFAK